LVVDLEFGALSNEALKFFAFKVGGFSQHHRGDAGFEFRFYSGV